MLECVHEVLIYQHIARNNLHPATFVVLSETYMEPMNPQDDGKLLDDLVMIRNTMGIHSPSSL